RSTSAVAAPIHCHPNWMWDKRGSTRDHCVARDRAAKNNTAAAKIHCATLKSLRRVGAKDLSVYLCVAARRRLRRERRERVEAPCSPQLATTSIAGEQTVE